MFSNNKDKNMDAPKGQNIIAQGTKIVGDVVSEGDFRVDGTIEGNLKTTGKVVVGGKGYIKGTLKSADAYFEGKFSGELDLSGTLTLKSSAFIEGNIVVGKLAVDPGATFNVTCTMKGTVKEMNKSDQATQEERKLKANKPA